MAAQTSSSSRSCGPRPSRWLPYVDSWPQEPRAFGARLKATMRLAGLTQQKVRTASKLSDTALRRVLYGRTWATQSTRWSIIRALEGLTAQTGDVVSPRPTQPPAPRPPADDTGLDKVPW